jgi:hypothetical protein
MSTEVIAFTHTLNAFIAPQQVIQIKKKSIKTMIMKKSSRTCPICIEGFKED